MTPNPSKGRGTIMTPNPSKGRGTIMTCGKCSEIPKQAFLH
jgi:hypothetical protein